MAFFAGTVCLSAATAENTLWETRLSSDAQAAYDRAVEALFRRWEDAGGASLRPGAKGRAGLKIETKMGVGLSTPKPLIRATVRALEKRGWKREALFLFDLHGRHFYEAGFLPDARTAGRSWEGVPIRAFIDEGVFDDDWVYDSPLPTADVRELAARDVALDTSLERLERERKSFLPKCLFLETDFWINLPVAAAVEGILLDGALANATLNAVSNGERFYAGAGSGPVAMAEIGAIPEMRRTCRFTLMSLESYQYAGSGIFNARYTAHEPLLWLCANPVWTDYCLFLRFNERRRWAGLPELPEPLFLGYAQRIGLGNYRGVAPKIERVF